MQRLRFFHIILIIIVCIFSSCNSEEQGAIYNLPYHTENIKRPLLVWQIKTERPSFDSIYVPLYNQLDLKEVCIDSGATAQLACIIKCKDVKHLYLEIKSIMPSSFTLNGDTLHRTEIQGLNIYPLKLAKGCNKLCAAVQTIGDDWSFESTIYDSLSIAQLYAEEQSCNIIYPLIPADTKDIMLTNAHQNVLNQLVSLKFSDTKGKLVSEVSLLKDSFVYHVPQLGKDVSYMCSMQIGNSIVRQPVLCGKDDDAFVKFTTLCHTLPDGHARLDEIDQVLYRLRFLLNHPSRYEGDWWWQFKITPLTYQLEHIFTHLSQKYGESETEFNVNFISYRSATDDSLQRYLLVKPNAIPKNETMPLVVIIRPFCENLHHFFASPQMARQWAMNIVQGLANHYGFIVMMPEARMSLDEDLTPIAEQEVTLAIEDVKKHYKIDDRRIYLQANCTGGYRALKYAEAHPDLFSAIALYAPVYKINFPSPWSKQNTAKKHISKLKGMPLMIHYDPMDEHSTTDLFEELIADCKTNGIPLTLSVKRNSGQFYNVVIAGEEAFEYFNHIKNK